MAKNLDIFKKNKFGIDGKKSGDQSWTSYENTRPALIYTLRSINPKFSTVLKILQKYACNFKIPKETSSSFQKCRQEREKKGGGGKFDERDRQDVVVVASLNKFSSHHPLLSHSKQQSKTVQVFKFSQMSKE